MTRVQQTAAILFVAVLILGGWAWSHDDSGTSPSDLDPTKVASVDVPDVTPGVTPSPEEPRVAESSRRQGVIASLTIFVLAVFVGIEVISKVPPTLHTPLMSGSNAISGIALVGAVIVAASVVDGLSTTVGIFARFLGFIAVTLAMINAVGGFMVTHRMLSMFTRK